jgi:type VI secretion system secreted protein Hcp
MSPLVVQKLFDKASPKAAQACAAGDHFANAVLTLNRAGGDKQPYMEYKMSDVMISSVQVGGAGEGGVPTESWSLHYGKIDMKYTQIGLDGKPAGNIGGGWDLKKNKKI